MNEDVLRFYAISDDTLISEDELINKCEIVFSHHVTCFQVRNKSKSYSFECLKELKNLCDRKNVALIINDDLDLAIKLNADGLHIGWDDVDFIKARASFKGFIGMSASNFNEALKAYEMGASYLGIGACFSTNTKADAKYLSDVDFKKIMSLDIAKAAIGGINKDNILKLKPYGVKNVCFVSAIFGSKDLAKACDELWEKITQL